MRNWKEYVREQLELSGLKREERIIDELADQLGDFYGAGLERELSPDEADEFARGQIKDWSSFESDIRRADRPHRDSAAERLAQRAEAAEANTDRGSLSTMLADLYRDVLYGFRMLQRNPGFTTVAVVTLALGIGANTAIYSVVDTILLRPLPFRDAEQLVVIWNEYNGSQSHNSVPDYFDRVQQSEMLESVAALNLNIDVNLTGQGEPVRISGAAVTSSFFSLMGVAPALGRTFTAEEDQPGQEQVVVLSHDSWKRQFGADSSIVGKTVHLNGQAHTVIGVMPENFRIPLTRIDIWKPIAFSVDQKGDSNRGNEYLHVFGRLNPGYTLEQVEAEMDAIAARAVDTVPSRRDFLLNTKWGAVVVPLRDHYVGDVKPALLVLLGAVGLVLLIACANVANLLLARGLSRERELAVRAALGADRSRVVRQLLTENVLLSLLGGMLGVLLAYWGLRALLYLSPANIPLLLGTQISGFILGVTIALSCITGILFGLIPALHFSGNELTTSLKANSRTTGDPRRQWVSNVLVTAEIALALMLLVGAGLLLRSFRNLTGTDTGFQSANRLTLSISLPSSTYPEMQQRTAFFQNLLQRIDSIPSVQAAGATHVLPFSGRNDTSTFYVKDYVLAAGESAPGGAYRIITPGYFRAMGIPVLQGRPFEKRDEGDGALRVLVDESLVRRYWPDRTPLGKYLGFDRMGPWREVIGVVRPLKNVGLDIQGEPQIYIPFTRFTPETMSIVIHTTGDPLSLARTVRAEIHNIDRNLPVYDVEPLEQRVHESLTPRRFSLLLLVLFATVGLLLAAIGIYGVISYSVNQRIHEFGIRLSLGARSLDVLTMVLRQGLMLIVVGTVVGMAAAFTLTRFLESLLFGVTANDLVTFTAIPVILAGVAMLACYIPARRAATVDPMVALRYE